MSSATTMCSRTSITISLSAARLDSSFVVGGEAGSVVDDASDDSDDDDDDDANSPVKI